MTIPSCQTPWPNTKNHILRMKRNQLLANKTLSVCSTSAVRQEEKKHFKLKLPNHYRVVFCGFLEETSRWKIAKTGRDKSLFAIKVYMLFILLGKASRGRDA